jgi:RNA-directed DNA polymerase
MNKPAVLILIDVIGWNNLALRVVDEMDANLRNELKERWDQIQENGGPQAYIEKELRRKGVWRRHRPDLTTLRVDREKKQAIEAYRKEDAERKKLRRFVWEAYQSVHLVHLGLDVYWNDFVGEDFFDPFQRTRRLEDNGLVEIATVDQLVTILQEADPSLDKSKLRWYCYHRDVSTTLHYRQFGIPKKTGGIRQIWAPMKELKAIQRWILENIVERLPIHGSAHGFVAGRSIVTNAQLHCDSSVVVNVDLKDFFPTFSFKRVKGVFRSAGYMEGIATLLALLCTEAPRRILKLGDETLYVATGPRCLPQGSPASPALTNVACMRLDRRLTGYANAYGWRYSRYADDLTFSFPMKSEGEADVRSLLSMLDVIVEEEGLRIHPDKTKVRNHGQRQEVTGLIVNGDSSPRVPKEVRRMLRSALHNSKNAKSVADGYGLEQLLGYSAFVYATDPISGREWINAFQEQLNQL